MGSCLWVLVVGQFPGSHSGQSAFEQLKIQHNVARPEPVQSGPLGQINQYPPKGGKYQPSSGFGQSIPRVGQINQYPQQGGKYQPGLGAYAGPQSAPVQFTPQVKPYAPARIAQNGVPLDAPDVAAAKAAHFEAHAKALNHLRYGRSIHYNQHDNGHGYGHAYSTQNHQAHFGPHHEFHVGGHGHYRRRRDAHYHGHAYSTQNHNAYFGHPHVVHVSGGGDHGHHGHHVFRRDTGAASTSNSNSFFGESQQIKVSGNYAPTQPGVGVPHETAEVQLAKQAHFLEREKVLKQAGYRHPGRQSQQSAYGYNEPQGYNEEAYESRAYY